MWGSPCWKERLGLSAQPGWCRTWLSLLVHPSMETPVGRRLAAKHDKTHVSCNFFYLRQASPTNTSHQNTQPAHLDSLAGCILAGFSTHLAQIDGSSLLWQCWFPIRTTGLQISSTHKTFPSIPFANRITYGQLVIIAATVPYFLQVDRSWPWTSAWLAKSWVSVIIWSQVVGLLTLKSMLVRSWTTPSQMSHAERRTVLTGIQSLNLAIAQKRKLARQGK